MYKDDIEKVLLTTEQIQERVAQLGAQITKDYAGEELLAIGILKGGIVFFADLIRCIDLPVQFDFMALSSYGASTKSSGVVRFLKDLDEEIEGKNVLIVEDIIDTGLTLRYLMDNLMSRKPTSVKICSLLDKPSRRKTDVKPAYIGFSIPDYFVVGYGLDYNAQYRNLPYVGVLKPEAYGR
ncbi:MAG: hypoxanthine phosphoribosyltransferase [Christensenellales bacterium]|jgi:hypoxanthine phosphoribosyltransferase